MDSCAGSLWLRMPAVIALMMASTVTGSLLKATVLTSSVAKYFETAFLGGDGGGGDGGADGGGSGASPGAKGGRGGDDGGGGGTGGGVGTFPGAKGGRGDGGGDGAISLSPAGGGDGCDWGSGFGDPTPMPRATARTTTMATAAAATRMDGRQPVRRRICAAWAVALGTTSPTDSLDMADSGSDGSGSPGLRLEPAAWRSPTERRPACAAADDDDEAAEAAAGLLCLLARVMSPTERRPASAAAAARAEASEAAAWRSCRTTWPVANLPPWRRRSSAIDSVREGAGASGSCGGARLGRLGRLSRPPTVTLPGSGLKGLGGGVLPVEARDAPLCDLLAGAAAMAPFLPGVDATGCLSGFPPPVELRGARWRCCDSERGRSGPSSDASSLERLAAGGAAFAADERASWLFRGGASSSVSSDGPICFFSGGDAARADSRIGGGEPPLERPDGSSDDCIACFRVASSRKTRAAL